jgi:hypothetical protein
MYWHPEFQNGFKIIGWESLNWIDLAQGRNQLWAVVNMVANLGDSIKCGECCYEPNCALGSDNFQF